MDARHRDAVAFVRRLSDDDVLVTHNYAIVETASLALTRIGAAGIRNLFAGIAPRLEIVWVEPDLHETAVAALLAAGRRRPSLVEWVSFEVMRREGIDVAFAFDRDFKRQGFRVVP